VLSNREIKIYAKSGIGFDENLTKMPHYEATIIPYELPYSIVEGASIKTEGKQQVLVLNLDKSYPEADLKDITVTLE
jgi:hypothetical protein